MQCTAYLVTLLHISFSLYISLLYISNLLFFIQHLFFLQDGKMMFEQELYNNFIIYLPKPYFITFAGDVSCPLCSLSHFSFTFLLLIFFVSSQHPDFVADFVFHFDTFCIHSWKKLERADDIVVSASLAISLL